MHPAGPVQTFLLPLFPPSLPPPEYGSYSAGYHQAPCTSCGEGFNTTDQALPSKVAKQGASASENCAVDFGWSYVSSSDTSKGLKPCTRGFFKDTLGGATCSQCPNGTTTTITIAAVAKSDCNACRAGFGSSSVNLAAPACGMCDSGTYSPGFIAGGAACLTCPTLEHFTGLMVTRPGAATSAECIGEFPTDAGTMENGLDWDYIKFPASSLTAVTGADDEAACQATCAGEPRCQYFEFRDYKAAGDRCRYKLAAAPIAPVDITSTGNYVMFEVATRAYVVYTATDGAEADGTGETMGSPYALLAAAKDACDAADACAGISYSATSGSFRLFKGTLFDFTVGKVRAVGETINSWLPLPDAGPFAA